jgi:hypothetical protein
MLVSLSAGMFSPKKTDKKVTKEVIDQHHAAESAGKFVKQILPEEALDAIKKLISEARQYHYENTCPWTDEGARILPSTKYLEYVDKMRRISGKMDDAVAAFMDRFDDYVETQRTRLNGMFNAEDYPPKATVRKKFTFKSTFLPFPDAADFRVDIADEEMAELRVQMEKRVNEATEAARRDLWKRLAAPLKTMAERLSQPDPRIFDTVVSNVQDIVDLIPALNITDDPDLERIRTMVQEARLTNVSADTLRKSPNTRRETAAKANDILATMAAYLPADEKTPAAPPMELPQAVPLPAPSPALLPTLQPVIPATPPVPSWRRAISRTPAAV